MINQSKSAPHFKKKNRLVVYANRMRRSPVPSEKEAWRVLRSQVRKALKCKKGTFKRMIKRQVPFHNLYIVDFYIPKLCMVVEIDGPSHNGSRQKAYDKARTESLMKRRLKVVRFTNEQVWDGTFSLRMFELLSNKTFFPKKYHPTGPVSIGSPVKIYSSNNMTQNELRKLLPTRSQ